MITVNNWAGNQEMLVDSFEYPHTVQDIQQLLQLVANRQKKVRPVGALHSWSDILAGADCMVSLDKMDKILCLDSRGNINCSANISVKELANYLWANHLSLPIMGDNSQQTFVGGISTGTHGPSLQHGVLSDTVLSVTLVDGDGKVRTIADSDERLYAARLSLGLLGVVTHVTVKPVAAKSLKIEMRVQEDNAWVPCMQNDILNYEYFFSYWYSGVEKALVHRGKSIDYLDAYHVSNVLEQDQYYESVVSSLCQLASLTKVGAAEVHQLLFDWFFRDQVLTGPIHKVLVSDFHSTFSNAEYFVPFEQAREIFNEVKSLPFPDPVVITIRGGIKADQNWLSPAYQRDSVAIGCVVRFPPGRVIPESLSMFNSKMREIGTARPQWAKWCEHEKIDLRKHFPRLQDFLQLRAQFDPHNIFLSKKLCDLIG